MITLIEEKIALFKHYGFKRIGLSLLFSIVLSSLIIAPFIAVSINLILIYVRFIYPLLIGINLFIGVWVFLVIYWFYDTLKQYDKDAPINIKRLFTIDLIVKVSVIMVIGFILIIALTPNYIT